MSGIDRLFDLITRDSLWTTTMPTVTRTMVKVSTTEQMAIIPDVPDGPMLEISFNDGSDLPVMRQRLNLAAVDDLIGKLIKMRDRMAAMKEHQ